LDDQRGTNIHLDADADKLLDENHPPDFMKARLGNND